MNYILNRFLLRQVFLNQIRREIYFFVYGYNLRNPRFVKIGLCICDNNLQRAKFIVTRQYHTFKSSGSRYNTFEGRSLKQKKRNITSMSEIKQEIFQGIPDRYQGLTIDSTKEVCTSEVFEEKLIVSLSHWTRNNVRTVWFKIAVEHADWVPILAKNGFSFHHAQIEFVMMYRWLPTTESSNIPRFAHTMIGVGAIVVNSSNEVLVVREKYFPKGFPHWKLPGGYVEQGEDIEDAAIREVLEETSIESKFDFLISFRHTHGVNFGCSDLYFIASLTPLTEEIKKCDREIMACEWMKIEEFLQHQHVHETNRFFVKKYLEYKNTGKIIKSQKGTHPLLKRPFTVFNIDDLCDNQEEACRNTNSKM